VYCIYITLNPHPIPYKTPNTKITKIGSVKKDVKSTLRTTSPLPMHTVLIIYYRYWLTFVVSIVPIKVELVATAIWRGNKMLSS
jgi:hypothetical protein